MTAKSGDKLDLGAISGPSTPPPSDPDDLTTDEIRKAKTAAKRPSPSDRHAAAVDRHLDDACGERDHLRQENRRLQSELDRLAPAHQRLEEAFSNSRFTSALSTIFLAVAGILVSAASYYDFLKTQILWAGYGFFACGLSAYLLNLINSRPKR
jgi:hypothetical protein